MSANIVEFPIKKPVGIVAPTLDQEWEQIERLNKEVQDLLREISRWGRKEQRAQNFLRYRFNVSNATELTIGDMREAIPMLKETAARCKEFSKRMHQVSDAFDEDVVGRGAPWTPWIARNIGKRRMHEVGNKPNWEALLKELEGEMEAR